MARQPALDHATLELLRDTLPEVANHTIAAVTAQVPAYSAAFEGSMGATIEQAVQMALAGFLRVAGLGSDADPGIPDQPSLEGAYALGRGEARSGRSADALLSAYRVGARAAWRELADTAVAGGASADTLATFAELVFAYIDELSAASVAGHTDELATTGRVRQAYLDRLANALLRGDRPQALTAAAARADWEPPRHLTAVALPEAQVRPVLSALDQEALMPQDHAAGEGYTVLLVRGFAGAGRRRLLRTLVDRGAVVGPVRPWQEVRTSYERALRAMPLLASHEGPDPLDTDAHLGTLLVDADPEAREDLRARVLAPLRCVRDSTAEKLEETLRSWLLHQGRREAVAADLFVHPQTVRYRMGQLRELYGDALDDPEVVRDLVLALA